MESGYVLGLALPIAYPMALNELIALSEPRFPHVLNKWAGWVVKSFGL